jgi:endonuclease YncB( thermonuclease family)
MRRFSILAFWLLTGLIFVVAAQSDDLLTARVVGVAGGDLITVLEPENKPIKIRLHGIDSPELGQPFGEKAKQFTSEQCFGKIVMYRLVGIDRFDRTIATVYLEDGRELNLEILKAGYAWHFRQYLDKPDYASAEAEARKAGIGLWIDKDPTPPWEWRRERRRKN